MVKWTWKRWALHPACHTPWNGGKSLGPGDGPWRDQQRKWWKRLNENQFNSSGRHQCSEECEKSVEEKEKGRTLQVPCERLWTGKVETRVWRILYTSYILHVLPCPFVMPPKGNPTNSVPGTCKRIRTTRTKFGFCFRLVCCQKRIFAEVNPHGMKDSMISLLSSINQLSDSPSNWMHLMNQWYHVASNHCLL